MKTFTLTDLKNRTGKVVDAAIREPISLTKHGSPKLVILSQDEFERMAAVDPRRVYRLDELPAQIASELMESLENVTQASYESD